MGAHIGPHSSLESRGQVWVTRMGHFDGPLLTGHLRKTENHYSLYDLVIMTCLQIQCYSSRVRTEVNLDLHGFKREVCRYLTRPLLQSQVRNSFQLSKF